MKLTEISDNIDMQERIIKLTLIDNGIQLITSMKKDIDSFIESTKDIAIDSDKALWKFRSLIRSEQKENLDVTLKDKDLNDFYTKYEIIVRDLYGTAKDSSQLSFKVSELNRFNKEKF